MLGRGRTLFSALFFFSGLAGLVYEVSWTRLLRLPMGNTVYSLTVVLTAFMAGLALGSIVAGRWIVRHGRPLRVYAALEAAIGLFCICMPWIVHAEEPFFRWMYQHLATSFIAFHLMKFAACGLVILIPATLMGATLPVLCRHFVADPHGIGRSIGWLYAINAFGAVVGSLLAGFVLIPHFGLASTIRIGVATSLGVALTAWIASRRWVGEQRGTPTAPQLEPLAANLDQTACTPRMRLALLAGYGLSGLAAMIFQIAWARVLALVIGSSVYAFALLVAAFILGLAIGSSVASRFADRLRQPGLGFAVAELGIGFTALAMIPVLAHFPIWMVHIVPSVWQDFGRFQLVQFTLLFATLLLPTACMGACLPLVGRALTRGVEQAAETVGTAYSTNAAGTILGAFLGGFAILPALGIQRTILVGAAVNLLVGTVLLALVLPRRRGSALVAGVAIASVAALLLVPRFDPVTLSSGAFYYAKGLQPQLASGASLGDVLRDEFQILFHREGLASTITVKQNTDGDRMLAINGKVDASDEKDMVTQLLSGHLVCLLHPAPRDAAIIGLATGVTMNSAAQYPTMRSIDCIEIDPEMAQACHYFDHVNGKILDDPRVRLVIQDGRNHLTLTDKQYDVILSEPSNPWVAGIASLYTHEFLESCRQRLRPGGLMCLWVHVYGFDLHAIQSMIRTFSEVFPECSLWETYFLADYVLIGSRDRLEVRWEDLEKRLAEPRVRADLARVHVESAADLLVRHVADADGIQRLSQGGEIYHDDDNQLEFAAPRLIYHELDIEELKSLQDVRRPGLPGWLIAPTAGIPARAGTALESAQQAQRLFWNGMEQKLGGNAGTATRLFLQALELDPRLGNVGDHLLETTREVVDNKLAAGDTLAAERLYQHIIELGVQNANFYDDLGVLEAQRGHIAVAESLYRQAVQIKPHNLQMRTNLGLSLAMQGHGGAAEQAFNQVLAQRANYVPARLQLGNLDAQRGDAAAAIREYRLALTAEPHNGEAWFLLAEALRNQGGCRAAVTAYESALRYEPRLAMASRQLAACYRELGEADKAARLAGRPTPSR